MRIRKVTYTFEQRLNWIFPSRTLYIVVYYELYVFSKTVPVLLLFYMLMLAIKITYVTVIES